ncbi:adhesin transport system outer membrane protein [Rhodobacter viridis]|uniref:Adhesin transport system outer membrane protein n=1 Tax=Rhodobacter viridis TaxID=1054202 RepID=A0A318U0Y3_9RHOB|nr:TolC family protein [Rhodobacter viridis]PYF11799.1 adhesin transport system outer membrane protein [Rhodobacter viridis]
MTRKSSFAPLLRASTVARMSAAALIATGLSGCMEGTPFPSGRSAFSPATASLVAGKPGTTAETSAIIADLSGRVSVLPASGPYAQVADAVLRDAKGTAKAELRVARLTAQAKSKNWLPQIGPSLSLTRLGDLAAELLISQTLWDNGAKRAEREAAAADVEVAAVSLSTEMNDTVAEGLKAYVNALKAREQAEVADRSVAKLNDFNEIMKIRVEGGLSDGTEARVLSQKLSEMQATAQADRDTAQAAMTQLGSMTSAPLDGLVGMSDLALPEPLPGSLAVSKSRAEAERAEAEAQISRAGNLPKIGAEASVGTDAPDVGLTVGIDQMLGFGTKAQLEAVAATREAAAARVARTEQSDTQDIAALRAKIAALEAKEARDGAVVAETGAGLEMFTEQYKMGRRTLMDLVSLYESYAQMAHAQAGLKYDIALIKLEIARKHGILVDGGTI